MSTSNLVHVDVFATGPLSGNGLCVFLHTEVWPTPVMQSLTREMKQFESIFLADVSAQGATARVFTVDEELPFAGHPVLGAAAVLHHTQTPQATEGAWTLHLPVGELPVRTIRIGGHFRAEMNPGAAQFGECVSGDQLRSILSILGLDAHDLVAGITPQVVSTGLPYLILPVHADALARARITGNDLEMQLAALGAKFVLVLDVIGREQRTWDNLGHGEDVATGSAAGPAAAFLFAHELADPALPVDLAQGRFAGRSSTLRVRRDGTGSLFVSGEVWPVMEGTLDPGALRTTP